MGSTGELHQVLPDHVRKLVAHLEASAHHSQQLRLRSAAVQLIRGGEQQAGIQRMCETRGPRPWCDRRVVDFASMFAHCRIEKQYEITVCDVLSHFRRKL